VIRRLWQLVAPVAWAPLLVFIVHVLLDDGLAAYDAFPRLDVPMHFAGGLAIAYVMRTVAEGGGLRADTGWPRFLPHAVVIVTGTATAAVLWEFAEFGMDRVFGTNLQVSLANTMRDLAMGLLGAVALAVAGAIRDADRRRPR
jgi:hypothetical protein